MRPDESVPAREIARLDRLHLGLALLLGALAGVVLWTREPAATGSSAAGSPAAEPRASAPSRAALESAITELTRWFERPESAPRTPLQANLRLLALGRAALGPGSGGSAALIWNNLEALAHPPQREARPASLPASGSAPLERDASAAATLAILLETGVPLDEALPLPSGAISVRQLLEHALAAPTAEHDGADPWSLDLLSFAVLADMPRRRPELARQVAASLTRLEREQRALAPPGQAGAAALGARATQRRRGGGDPDAWARELALVAAVFRAVAVLGEPELEQRALRYLNGLWLRHEHESELRELSIEHAPTPAGRRALQVAALEALGRLEQALYGAHVAFRREERPAPRAASQVRRVAAELLVQLDAAKLGGAFAPDTGRAEARDDALARAVAHALRGLRTARVAT